MPRIVLTPEKRVELLILAHCGIKLEILARRYQVTPGAVSFVLRRLGYQTARDHISRSFNPPMEYEMRLLIGHCSYIELAAYYQETKDTIVHWFRQIGVKPGHRKIELLYANGRWKVMGHGSKKEKPANCAS